MGMLWVKRNSHPALPYMGILLGYFWWGDQFSSTSSEMTRRQFSGYSPNALARILIRNNNKGTVYWRCLAKYFTARLYIFLQLQYVFAPGGYLHILGCPLSFILFICTIGEVRPNLGDFLPFLEYFSLKKAVSSSHRRALAHCKATSHATY